jgi:hypothetical protein
LEFTQEVPIVNLWVLWEFEVVKEASEAKTDLNSLKPEVIDPAHVYPGSTMVRVQIFRRSDLEFFALL